jgi:hypothetical protein
MLDRIDALLFAAPVLWYYALGASCSSAPVDKWWMYLSIPR